MMENLFRNPEIRKSVWLDMSLNRLIIMPVILGLLFFMTVISDKDWIENLNIMSAACFGFIVLLWGTKEASDSILGEINDRTWDSQRLTLITPREMTLGKLFGSTIYQWYGAAYCVFVYMLTSLALPFSVGRIKAGILFIVLGIFIHAFAISMSLFSIERNRFKTKVSSTFIFILSLIITSPFLSFYEEIIYNDNNPIKWFLFELKASNFYIASILFFATWAIVGLYRSMRKEFQILSVPWHFIAFVSATMIYLFGLAFNLRNDISIYGLYYCLVLVVGLTYFLAFNENKDIVEIRLLISLFKERNWKEFLRNIPLWMISFAMVIDMCILIALLFPFLENHDWTRNTKIDSFMYTINVLIFIIRDISLLLFLHFRENTKRTDASMILYLAVLYWLVPAIFEILDYEVAMEVFLPVPGAGILTGTLLPLIQAGFTVFLMVGKFKNRQSKFPNKQSVS